MSTSAPPRARGSAAAAPSGSTVTPGSTAARVLDAAERHFATRGYAATSLGDIADDVGIRAPSLYKHFASKRALYLAVLERLLDPYVTLLGGLLIAPANAAEAEANLAAVMDHYLGTPRLASLVQHAALGGGDDLELVVERHRPLFARATRLSRRPAAAKRPGHDAPDPVQLVMAFHALLSGYVTMAPFHHRLTGRDPLAPRALAGFRELMARLARGLWDAPDAAASASRSARRRARG
jgi:TetR/AcrR family transcriptional regulator